MLELLWLLLPVAAASGWWAAKREGSGRERTHSGNNEGFKGLNYLLDERPDQLIDAFVRAVDVDRDTADTHLALGSLFRRRGEVDRAISIHSNLIARDSLSTEQRSRAVLELGEDYMRAGLFDRAEALFRQLVGQPDHTTVALARLVGIYEQEKDWREAIEHCDRLEHLTGQSRKVETAQFCCELAEQAWQQRDARAARTFLRQALSRDPQCVRASMLQGDIALAEGDYSAAVTAFQTIERQNRCYLTEIIPQLEQCYAALGRPWAVLDYLRGVHAHDHSGRLTDLLATLLLRQQGEAAARCFLEDELRNYPTLLGLRRLVELKLALSEGTNSDLHALYRISQHMLDDTARYQCDKCGFIGKSLHWCCPGCKSWGSIKSLPDMVFKKQEMNSV
jgi:lipopolysaccharide biosynthesis regulator YciM